MLETKIALLGYFWAAIWKNLFISEINTLEFVKSQSFIQNKEIWNQKYLSRVVLGQNLKKNYCRIWNQHLQICQNAKFHVKWKKIKFGTKIALFGFFWTGNWKKTLAIFEISTLEFIKTQFLTITVNFGLGSTFSKSRGSISSEGPGSGLLYNVCPERERERVIKEMLLLNVIRTFSKKLCWSSLTGVMDDKRPTQR